MKDNGEIMNPAVCASARITHREAMSTQSSADTSSAGRSRSSVLLSSLDPRLCPRVMVDVEPPQGRTLSTPHLDTVKIVHSYLRARSPYSCTIPDEAISGLDKSKKNNASMDNIGGSKQSIATTVQHVDQASSALHGCIQDLSYGCSMVISLGQKDDCGYKLSSKSVSFLCSSVVLSGEADGSPMEELEF